MKLLLKPKLTIIFWLNMYDFMWCIYIYQLIYDLFHYNIRVVIEPIYYLYLYKIYNTFITVSWKTSQTRSIHDITVTSLTVLMRNNTLRNIQVWDSLINLSQKRRLRRQTEFMSIKECLTKTQIKQIFIFFFHWPYQKLP